MAANSLLQDSNFRKFQEQSQNYGYKSYDKYVTCVVDDHLFVFTGATTTTLNLFIRFNIEGADSNSIIALLKVRLPDKVRFPKPSAQASDLVLTYVEKIKSPNYFYDLGSILQILVSTLHEFGVTPQRNCAICSGQNADAFGWHKDAFVAAHRFCLQAEYQKETADLTESLVKGSYLLGIIGAFLGTLIGAIPTFLSIFFLERIIIYLCALIPIAGAVGYRLFKGKPTWVAALVVLLFSLLEAFVIELAVAYATVMSIVGYWPSIIDVIKIYFAVFNAEMAGSLGLTILFIAIGVAVTFPFISRTAKKDLSSVAERMNSITDRR